MGYAEDLVEARKMKACIERYGVKVSIELQAGAGDSWSIGTHRLIMSHHTASKRSQGLTPCLYIVKHGRPDVPGPLANGYGGFDYVYRILTFGRANHPGAGGPLTLDGVTVPRDNGRPYCWGSEFEGGLEPYDDAMKDFMARVNAGLTDYFAARMGATVQANCEHKTWAPTRKIDRLGITREQSLSQIQAVMAATPSEEDEVIDYDELARRVWAYKNEAVNGGRDAYALLTSASKNIGFIQREGSGAVFLSNGLAKLGIPNTSQWAELRQLVGDSPLQKLAPETFDRIPEVRRELSAADVETVVRAVLQSVPLTPEIDVSKLGAAIAVALVGLINNEPEVSA